MSADGSSSQGDDRIQLNVTFRRDTLETLRDIFPTALEDSERVRQAVSESIERNDAKEYHIRRA